MRTPAPVPGRDGHARRGSGLAVVCATAGAWWLVAAPLVAAQQGLPAGTAPVTEGESLMHALLRLPLAAGLGAVLAMRPRRAGTPPRKPAVVQTQVILAVIGALVMIVVGVSLARAFGVVGIAGLIRYRAKIDDPKDASVMLAALGVGLASGVGLFWLAPFATVFILALLWLLESREPEATSPFLLTIKTKDAARLHRRVEATLRRHHIEYEPRSRSADELVYATNVPLERGTENISSAIVHLGQTDQIAVNWSEHKSKR